jgi:CRP/FNR family transcriptional regulator, cyclic AMP receptor protein
MIDINALVQAVQSLNTDDAFRARLNADQWRTVGQYLTQNDLRQNEMLIKQGDSDRTMYFLASGQLQVFISGGAPGSSRLSILRAGAVVGEPSLFVAGPRSANVEAMTPCTVFALRGPRLEELGQRSPALALELFRAAGAVMAVRMRNSLVNPTKASATT